MDSLPSDNESDCVYVSEDKTCSTSNSTPFSKNPKTTLDFLMLESETYEKYKIAEMIKQQIAEFSFDKKIIDEIINLCFLYRSKLKINRLLPIVIYKVIKKYNYPFSITDIQTKINFSRANYLKNSNIINVEGKAISYKESLLLQLNYAINKLLQEIRNNTNLIKSRWSKEKNNLQLIKMTNIFLNHTSSFCDSEEYMMDEIKTIKIKITSFIYQQNMLEKVDFNTYFKEKISSRVLSLSLIKYFLSLDNLYITFSDLHTLYKVPLKCLANGLSLIKEYISLNNIIINHL